MLRNFSDINWQSLNFHCGAGPHRGIRAQVKKISIHVKRNFSVTFSNFREALEKIQDNNYSSSC